MERMSFLDFNCDFILYSRMSNIGVSVYAPLIYSFEDKYFDACVEFLKTGNERNLEFGKYSIEIIKNCMGANYVQALVILHNIETNPDKAPMIFNPDMVE